MQTYRVSEARGDDSFRCQVIVDTSNPDLQNRQSYTIYLLQLNELTSISGNIACTCFRPSAEARTQRNLIFLTIGPELVPPVMKKIKKRTIDTPFRDHRNCCDSSSSGSNQRIQQEDLVNRRVRRQLGVILCANSQRTTILG
jgi:hypothetical protein